MFNFNDDHDAGAHHNPFQGLGHNPFDIRARAETIVSFAQELPEYQETKKETSNNSCDLDVGAIYRHLETTPFRDVLSSASPSPENFQNLNAGVNPS